MDKPTLRLMIQDKVADGRLPHHYIPRVRGGLGNGETCDGCAEPVTRAQVLMEGLSGNARRGVKFHGACFYVWDATRQVLGYKASGRLVSSHASPISSTPAAAPVPSAA